MWDFSECVIVIVIVIVTSTYFDVLAWSDILRALQEFEKRLLDWVNRQRMRNETSLENLVTL